MYLLSKIGDFSNVFHGNLVIFILHYQQPKISWSTAQYNFLAHNSTENPNGLPQKHEFRSGYFTNSHFYKSKSFKSSLTTNNETKNQKKKEKKWKNKYTTWLPRGSEDAATIAMRETKGAEVGENGLFP